MIFSLFTLNASLTHCLAVWHGITQRARIPAIWDDIRPKEESRTARAIDNTNILVLFKPNYRFFQAR